MKYNKYDDVLVFILYLMFIGWLIHFTPVDNIIIGAVNEVFDKSYSTKVFYLLYMAIVTLYCVASNRGQEG